MTINLTQIRSDFDNGIIVSKQTLLALVDYAIELENSRVSLDRIASACVAANISDSQFEQLSIDLLYGNQEK